MEFGRSKTAPMLPEFVGFAVDWRSALCGVSVNALSHPLPAGDVSTASPKENCKILRATTGSIYKASYRTVHCTLKPLHKIVDFSTAPAQKLSTTHSVQGKDSAPQQSNGR